MIIRLISAMRKSWRRLAGTELRDEIARRQAEISILSVDEARKLALKLLGENASRYHIMKSPPTSNEEASMAPLAPCIREFFQFFLFVQPINSDTIYDRRKIGQAHYAPKGWVRIATSVEHTELVVRPNDESVFEVDGHEASESDFVGIPSIYHWIVYEDWIINGGPE